jgi:signal transduction histidine kinase
MSLGTRFALAIAALTTFVLLAYSGVLLWAERQHLVREAEKAHWITVEHLGLACGDALLSQNELGLIDFMNELKTEGSLLEAACVDPQGKVIMHTDLSKKGKKADGAPAGPEKEFRREGDVTSAWDYRSPVLQGGRWVATARVVYNGERVLGRLRMSLLATVGRFMWVGVGVLFLGTGLSFLAARTLTRPIHALAAGARQIGSGALDTRVSEKAPGELGGLAREFNGMALRLRELDEMKERILYAISHDLRNPLSAISTAAKVLRLGHFSDEDRTLIESIERGALRLRAMVNNVLDAARLKEGEIPFRKTIFQVGPLVEELARLYGPIAAESNKIFMVTFPEHLPSLEADEEKTLRIFLNLVANAFKFTRRGESIVISGEDLTNGFVEFGVKDTGPGISPERLSRLFEPVRVLNTGPQEGSGMGLSIVKSLVEGHGGQLRVETAVGKGTAILFTLPVAKGTL